MLYGNGLNFDFISESPCLVADYDEVSGYYNTIRTHYLENQDDKWQDFGYDSEVQITRNSSSMTVMSQNLQVNDIVVYPTWSYTITAVTVHEGCDTADYFWKHDNIVRNGTRITAKMGDLLPGDKKVSDDNSYIQYHAIDKRVELKAQLMNILCSNSGFHYPENTTDALFVARTVQYDNASARNEHIYSIGSLLTRVIDGEYDNTSKVPISTYAGPWGIDNYNVPFYRLYQCTNWWEFAKTPIDISTIPSAHLDAINSDYGGYGTVSITAYINRAEKQVIPNKNININYFSTTKPLDFKVTNPNGMPDQMGGAILFSANDTFDSNKLVGIGFKGLRSYNINDNDDISFKLYRFTNEYFKSIGNNFYTFNDPKMICVKGMDNSDGPYAFGYAGPFFVTAEMEAGSYTDTNKNKDEKIKITKSDYIRDPYLFTSISYLSTGFDAVPTSGKPETWFSCSDFSADCHLKTWTDSSNGITYFDCVPMAPGIPISTGTHMQFELQSDITEFEFGCAMSAMGCISKYDNSTGLSQLKAVNGSWKYCNNIVDFGYPGGNSNNLFYNASSLETIPSSWEGLESVTSFNANSMFYNCQKLVSIPSSFNHLGNKSYTATCSMFYNCYALKNGLKTWENLDNVTTADSMFYNCVSLESIPDNFEHLGNLIGCQSMFYNCYKLKEVKSWNGINGIYNGYNMFYNCSGLSAIPSTFNGINTKFKAPSMFQNCFNLKSIPAASEWDSLFQRLTVSNYPNPCSSTDVVSISNIFNGCSAITGTVKEILDVFIRYNISKAGQFYGCSGFSDYNECHGTSTYSGYI